MSAAPDETNAGTATPAPERGDGPRVRFSLVTAVHDVARYLPDFIASVEGQQLDLGLVEVVAVDDGSTDDSLELLRAWEARRPGLVTVLSKPNGGQGSARNLGLDHVRGEWVSFPDPDDTLAPDYLLRVQQALEAWPDVAMVATNRVILVDETGELVEKHPLRSMFAHRDQVRDLDRFPDYFHGAANAAFFRRAVVEDVRLRFDERIRPNFEDGHLCQRYLLQVPERRVAFLKSARYHYRKRLDQTSTLQTGSTWPERFTAVPRHGYLELLREAAELGDGQVPEWLQNMIIYELSYYISPEDAGWSSATACHGAVAEEFVGLLREIRTLLDEDVIRGFGVRNLRVEWRQLLLHGLVDEPWHTPYVVLHRYDARRDEVLVSYRFTGAEPDAQVTVRGLPATPVATKRRDFVYFDHPLLHERMWWVSARGELRATIDGHHVEIRTWWAEYRRRAIRPRDIRRLGPSSTPRSLRPAVPSADELLLRLARSRVVRRRYARAWVLMDRVGDAGDNAERLFHHLRAHHPDVNAWFVVHADSPDHARLRREAPGRVVAFGSTAWKLLMLNCRHLISSHIDQPIVRPEALRTLLPRPRWTFTFLQHGVIKDDISGWLNNKRIDLFVTSTPAEHESIVGDGTRYAVTTKEVHRTGLPRFDRLRALAAATADDERRTILVAPTWRNWLSAPLEVGRYRREVVHTFPGSEYARNWLGLLRSERLRALCEEQGLRIGFLPHPNLQPVLDDLELPPHVDPLRYADHDVQRLFAAARVMVTDYSSVVFNAAYVDRPVVYFQFDAERVRLGGHLGRQGYFDYERDGFGPVAFDLEAAEEAVVGAARTGLVTDLYAGRVATAFPDRDGRCCERVVERIKAL